VSKIFRIVQDVLLGELPADDGRIQIGEILQETSLQREVSRGTCGYRVCRSLTEVENNLDKAGWHDFTGHLRQFLLTFKQSILVKSDIAESIKRILDSFRLFLYPDNEVTALKEIPSWLDNGECFFNVYNFPYRRPVNRVIGDGILHSMTGHTHYLSKEQKAVIYKSMDMPRGHTLLACLPTGGGKSLAGQLPAYFDTEGGNLSGGIDASGSTIVIVPTVSLAIDQAMACRKYFKGMYSPVAYHSGISGEERKEIYDGIRDGLLPILYISPEAVLNGPLHDVIMESAVRGKINRLVIDEAHIVVDWGGSFRPEFQFLAAFRRKLLKKSRGRIRTILLSATITDWTAKILRELFSEGDNLIEIRGDALRPEPMFWLDRPKSEEERAEKILELIPLLPRPVIIYVTKPQKANVWKELIYERGFERVATFTGDTPGKEREILLEMWEKNKLDIMVATSAFGMGVDKPDIRSVVHCCMPESINRYYQEVGRGGRDGFPSISIISVVARADGDETFNLINKKVLTAENIADRWYSMRQHPVEVVGGDSFWVDTDCKPPHLEGEQTGQRNAGFNETALLFLYRKGLIDILDTRPRGGEMRRHVLLKMNDLNALDDRELLIQEITPLRDAEWGHTSDEFREMKDLALNKKECWSRSFIRIYPYAEETCGGCPKCRHDGLLPFYSQGLLQVRGIETSPAPQVTGKLGALLGGGKEVLLYFKESLPQKGADICSLSKELINSGIKSLVVPERSDQIWGSWIEGLPAEDCPAYAVFEMNEIMGREGNTIYGPAALFYPKDEGQCNLLYEWSKEYLDESSNNMVIHVASKTQVIRSEGKVLPELIDGIQFLANKLIKEKSDEYDLL